MSVEEKEISPNKGSATATTENHTTESTPNANSTENPPPTASKERTDAAVVRNGKQSRGAESKSESDDLCSSSPELQSLKKGKALPSISTTNEANSAVESAHLLVPLLGAQPIVNKKQGIITIPGRLSDLWDCEKHNNSEGPSYPHGAGYSTDKYINHVVNSEGKDRVPIKFVPCRPYLKEPPPTSFQLESFDLRIVYEAGRTGFEDSKEYPIVINNVIAGRYQVLQYLDSAAFSRAVRCLDLKHNMEVCIKIIRNSKDFFDQSLDEIKLLQYINCNGDADDNCVLQLYDYFYFKEHIFIVCELLRDNLYEFSKFNREQETEFYFTMARVQAIARQTLKALSFIHSHKLLHCDLKPENILIKSYSRCEVKVIDFGSSSFVTDNLSSYIQSRCYRAPEVVLGCHYDGRIDVWSLGAILPELLTGNVLFHNDTVPGMLSRIAAVCGPFPARMLHEGRHTCRYVTANGVFFEKVSSGDVMYHFPIPDPLDKMNLGTNDQHFISFVKACLIVDYTERPTSAELLEHPFMKQDYGPVYSAPPPLKNQIPAPSQGQKQ
eukprot:Tbor_TRINITY_DN5693_c0_g1::TRINITY_DN5693_c0_g1_i1::g.9255::m.9255